MQRINQGFAEALHVISSKMTGTSCTDDARLKIPSCQKVTFFLHYEIFHRDVIRLYFCLFGAVSDCCDQGEHASNDLFQSDSSFLL